MPLQGDRTLLDYYDSTYRTYNDSYAELQEELDKELILHFNDDEEKAEGYQPDPNELYKNFDTSKFKRKDITKCTL